MSIQRLHIPPLSMGYAPTYFPGRSFDLSGMGKGFNYTPRQAIDPYTNFVQHGCTTVNINSGYGGGPSGTPGAYTSVPRSNRSVFFGPEYIQDSGGGKHWADFTLNDCRNAANYAWGRADGYGVMTSGAQEGRFDNDYWAQLSYGSTGSVSAYTNLSQAWGEIMVANPSTLYFGCYDGILYFNSADDPSALRNALSSNANALAYCLAHSYGPNPYWQQQLWRFHPPLLNLYFRSSTDLNAKNFEIRMAIKLTKMALAAVGRPDWPVMVFVFPGKTEFVNYPGQGYSEHYVRPVNGGGTYVEYNFPDYSHPFQWDQTFSALAIADHYYGWEDTLLYGSNPLIVANDYIRDDGFPFRKLYGGSGLTQVAMGPTPYNSTVTYPYYSSYEGHGDIAPLAAEMFAYMNTYAGKVPSVESRHRPAGSSGAFCSLDYGYLVDRFTQKQVVVDVARNGNLGWVRVADYVSPAIGPYDLEVDVGGGQSVIVNVEPGMANPFIFGSSDLITH